MPRTKRIEQPIIPPSSPELGPVLVQPKQDVSTLREVEIWIYSDLFHAKEKRLMTDNALEEYVNTLIKEGYTDYSKTKRTIIYPAHTINKIEVVDK